MDKYTLEELKVLFSCVARTFYNEDDLKIRLFWMEEIKKAINEKTK